MAGDFLIKVTNVQYRRESAALQAMLSTDLSTGSVDKETPRSELESVQAIPTLSICGATGLGEGGGTFTA
jgi:hypothetical protein